MGKDKFGPLTDKDNRLKVPGLERAPGKVPLQTKLPSATDMLNLSDAELLEVLQEYGVAEPWDSLRSDASAYIGRLKNIPNPDLFSAEVDNIVASSRRGIMGLTRRTQERYNTLSIIDGRPDVLLIRLPDDYDGDRLCENCEGLAGVVGTYSQHMAIGLPGAQSCIGGDYCRCSLMEIE